MTSATEIGALLPAVLMLFVTGCHGTRPRDLGVREGKLASCPSTPNCVSSRAPDEPHRVDPLPYRGNAGDAGS